jgi:hypothetical protein
MQFLLLVGRFLKIFSTETAWLNEFWPDGFRGEDFLEIDPPETRIACSGHVC